jgi:thiamine pyrophosphokinase
VVRHGAATDPQNLNWVIPAEEDVNRSAVIFSGGNTPQESRALVFEDAFIIAADSGLHAALALGVDVDLLIGDLDSADPTAVAEARRAGAAVDVHPADKDATDLELALEAAADRGSTRVRVIGGSSLDRIDHFIANALLLTADRFAHLTLDWWIEDARVTIVRREMTLTGNPNDLVTILATGGPAMGITTTGLKWPLCDEDLTPGSTRGVSNQMVEGSATITVEKGTILVIHTGDPRP